jgi:hypothetical protein
MLLTSTHNQLDKCLLTPLYSFFLRKINHFWEKLLRREPHEPVWELVEEASRIPAPLPSSTHQERVQTLNMNTVMASWRGPPPSNSSELKNIWKLFIATYRLNGREGKDTYYFPAESPSHPLLRGTFIFIAWLEVRTLLVFRIRLIELVQLYPHASQEVRTYLFIVQKGSF